MTNQENYYFTQGKEMVAAITAYPLGEQRLRALRALKDIRMDLFFATLALYYDVMPYPVTGEGVTQGAPAHAVGKYFVAHNAEDFPDAPVIPLATTIEKSFELACVTLGLEAFFERECLARQAMPRFCFIVPVPELEKQMARVVEQARRYETMSPTELGLKAGEEQGEFATAVLVETGAITHKTLKEPSFGEAADVLLCHLAALGKLYPHLTPEQIAEELSRWVYIKQSKYDALLESKHQ